MASPGQRRRLNPFIKAEKGAKKPLKFFGATKEFFLLPTKGGEIVIARFPFKRKKAEKKQVIRKAVRQ